MKIAVVGDPKDFHLLRRIKAFQEAGMSVTLISPFTFNTAPIAINDQYTVALDHPNFFVRFKNWKKYATFLRTTHFDFIYTWSSSFLTFFTHLFAKRVVFHTCIGSDLLEISDKNWLVQKLKILTLKAADQIFVFSPFMRQEAVRLGCHPEHIHLDWLGIEQFWFDTSKVQPVVTLPKAYPIIFSVRVLQDLYRIETIVQSIELLAKIYPKVCLVQSQHCYKASYRTLIKKKIQEKNLEKHVFFLPEALSYHALKGIFEAAQVVVMTPTHDATPSSLAEAWATKTPVVAANIPHYDDTWHKKYLIKTDPTPEKIASSIIGLLKDKELRERIQAQGYAYASQVYKGYALKNKDKFIKLAQLPKKKKFRLSSFFYFTFFVLARKILPKHFN